MSHTPDRSGTGLPWAAFILGAAGSLAANLIDAYRAALANGIAASGDIAAALFFALIVPVALLLVVEMLIRAGRGGGALAVVMWVGAGCVAIGAAVMSFSHMYKVMLSYGQPEYIAALMPLAVDGLMLVASVALARAGRAAHDAPEAAALTEPADVPAALPEVAEDVPETLPHPVPELADCGKAVPLSGTEDATLPESVPTVPRLRAAATDNETAREWVRAARRDGRKTTGKTVGDEFGKSERWGRMRISEVDRADAPTADTSA